MEEITTPAQPPELSIHQGQQLVRTHLDGHERSVVSKSIEIKNQGFSCASHIRIYILDIVGPNVRGPCSCFVTVSHPPSSADQSAAYHSNALPAMNKIITLILTHTSIPILSSTLDVTLSLVPFHYVLSPPAPISSDTILPLSAARKAGIISPEDAVRVDLMLGKFFGELHSRCQNDWFGLVRAENEGDDGSTDSTKYSWQETFSVLFDTVLSDIETRGGQSSVGIPFRDIRLYYSRAIGSFLFDDVQVPSLVWFTGFEDDIYIMPSQLNRSSRAGLAAILPNVSHALWGDPLLETFFMEKQSEAFMEAYKESGGEELIYLPRHKTKRLWYTLFLALIVLREQGSSVSHTGVPGEFDAKRTIVDTTEALKDAPCY